MLFKNYVLTLNDFNRPGDCHFIQKNTFIYLYFIIVDKKT